MKALLLGILLALASPALSAAAITSQNIGQLHAMRKGQTTVVEVKAAFGVPTAEEHDPNGQFGYLYSFDIAATKTAPRNAGFIAFLFDAQGHLRMVRLYEGT